MSRDAANSSKSIDASERLFAVSAHGEKLELFSLSSGLTTAIDPAVRHAQPIAGSEHLRSASGQTVRQTRPGVFVVAGSAIEYERVIPDLD